MEASRKLLEAPELHAGLVAGVVVLVVGALLLSELAARGAPRPGIFGPALVVATVGALAGSGRLDGAGPVPTRVVVALVLLWIAGEIGARTSLAIGAVLAVAGGLALVAPADEPSTWVTALLVLGPALAGTAVAEFDRRAAHPGLGPQLLAVSILGLYACVPDTELVLALLGAAIPLLLLTWPRVLTRLGPGGSYAAIGLFLWIATVGGAGRPGSIVGAVAALGLLVAEPVGRLLASRSTRTPGSRDRAAGRLTVVAFLVVQVLLALYAARVAGRVEAPAVAAALALPILVVGVLIGARAGVEPRG